MSLPPPFHQNSHIKKSCTKGQIASQVTFTSNYRKYLHNCCYCYLFYCSIVLLYSTTKQIVSICFVYSTYRQFDLTKPRKKSYLKKSCFSSKRDCSIYSIKKLHFLCGACLVKVLLREFCVIVTTRDVLVSELALVKSRISDKTGYLSEYKIFCCSFFLHLFNNWP